MDASWEGYRQGGCDPTPVNNERKLEKHEIRLDKLEDNYVALQSQLKEIKSTLDVVSKQCSTIAEKVGWDNLNDLFKGPVPLEIINGNTGWSPEERHDMRKKAEAINSKEHKRCTLCGSEVFVGASWMWNGMKGGTKPYFARCSKGGCKNVRPFLEGDTPEEAVQKWDEAQTATRVALENMR